MGGVRVEQDVGEQSVSGEFLTASLGSHLAKIYICERLIQHREGPLLDLRPSLYLDALPLMTARRPIRAPFPQSQGWLDWKGAFVHGDKKFQLKPPEPSFRPAQNRFSMIVQQYH